LADRVLALKEAGRAIIPLHVGDPDFDTHPAIVNAATSAMRQGWTHYASSRGDRELRLAISAKLKRDNRLFYNPENEIIVTHGGIHAYYLAIQSVLQPGDEVLVPDPSWATHVNMVTLMRGRAIRVHTRAEEGFIPKIEAWKAALTPKTRALVVNYPANPTGAYPSRNYLEKLQEFAAQNGIWVLSDEVYENIYYGEKPTSAGAPAGAKERTLIINSFSKSYAMTGWRIGFLAAPKAVIERAIKVGQNSITCVTPFIQKAATFALSEPKIQTAVAEMRAAYARRRALVLKIAAEYPQTQVGISPPQGAFYFFLDFRFLQRDSLSVCEEILEQTGVALVPGSAFGSSGEGFVRMTIAASDEDIEKGVRAVLEWAG
jgi:aspartate/methionine/tyrosine aminotransferase